MVGEGLDRFQGECYDGKNSGVYMVITIYEPPSPTAIEERATKRVEVQPNSKNIRFSLIGLMKLL